MPDLLNMCAQKNKQPSNIKPSFVYKQEQTVQEKTENKSYVFTCESYLFYSLNMKIMDIANN